MTEWDVNKFQVVDVGMADFREVADLCAECLPGNYPSAEVAHCMNRVNSISKGVMFNGKLIGFICAGTDYHHVPSLTAIVPIGYLAYFNFCYIYLLFVKKEYRRLGIATLCIQSILNAFSNTDFLYLHTPSENVIGLKFYKNLDFKIVKRLRNYYMGLFDDGKSDAFVLVYQVFADQQVKHKQE